MDWIYMCVSMYMDTKEQEECFPTYDNNDGGKPRHNVKDDRPTDGGVKVATDFFSCQRRGKLKAFALPSFPPPALRHTHTHTQLHSHGLEKMEGESAMTSLSHSLPWGKTHARKKETEKKEWKLLFLPSSSNENEAKIKVNILFPLKLWILFFWYLIIIRDTKIHIICSRY